MKTRMFLALMFGPLILWPSLGRADDGTWERVGNFSSLTMFYDISVCNIDNHRNIFAGESSGTSYIWHSTDDGATWLIPLRNPIINHYYKQVIMKPINVDQEHGYGWALVPGNGDMDQTAGPLRTTDGGYSWVAQAPNNLGGLSMRFECLAADTSGDMSTAYLGTHTTPTANIKLLKTTDGGGNWVERGSTIPGDATLDIAIYETDPQRIYCIFSDGGIGHLWYSTNAGTNWNLINTPSGISKVIVSPTDYSHLFTVDQDAPHTVRATTDGGVIWSIPFRYYGFWGNTHSIKYTRLSNTSDSIYIALNSQGDNGIYHWLARKNPDENEAPDELPLSGRIPGDRRAICVAVDPNNSDCVFIGCQNMLYYSDNASDPSPTFHECPGFYQITATRLAVDYPKITAQTDQQMFSYEYDPFFSTWKWTSEPVDTLYGGGVVRDWDSPDQGRWLAGFHPATDYTADAGAIWYYPYNDPEGHSPTWKKFFDPHPVHCLYDDPANPTIYAAGKRTQPEFHGYFYSSTNGETFQTTNFYAVIKSIDGRPGKDTLLVADSLLDIFKSPNRGSSWEPLGLGANTHPTAIQYCPNQPNIALAGTSDATLIYKSRNVDQRTPSWVAANGDIDIGATDQCVQAIKFYPVDNSAIFAAIRNSGTYMTADTGRSWFHMDAGLGDIAINDFAIDKNNPDFLYAAADNGVYKMTISVKSGIIAGEEFWGPGVVIVNGDVTIQPGAILQIAGGTTVKVVYNFDKNSTGNPNKTEFIVWGTLYAWGDENNPIVMESSKEIAPAAGQWTGIRAEAGSNICMKECTVKHGDYGIYSHFPNIFDVENCTFDTNLNAGIYVMGNGNPNSPITVLSTTIKNSGMYGMYCSTSPLTVKSSSIVDCSYGIYYHGDQFDSVYSCDIENHTLAQTYYGIYATKISSGVTAIIRGVPNSSSMTEIYGFTQGGIYLNGTTPTSLIANTEVLSCRPFGIFLNNSSCRIWGGDGTENLLNNNQTGLYLQNMSSPNVRRTRFGWNTLYGVYVGGGCNPDLGNYDPNAGDNSFIQYLAPPPGYRHLYNCVNTYAVNARNNFWNPSGPMYICNANVSPVLIYDPLPRREPPSFGLSAPNKIALAKAYPNPFNPTTTISFSLGARDFTTVRIYNITGQLVSTVFEGQGRMGENTIIWDGRNNFGVPVSTGVYFCLIRTEYEQATVKLTMLK